MIRCSLTVFSLVGWVVLTGNWVIHIDYVFILIYVRGKKILYFHTDIMVWNAANCVDLKLILEKYEVSNSIGALWKSQADV